jgi:hypothetical protein
MTTRRRCLAWLLFAGLIAVPPALLRAHPASDTYVVITLDDAGGFVVSVSSDARALALKLKALGGSLAQHVDVRFDGRPAPLVHRDTTDVPGRTGLMTVNLTGAVPSSARQLTFRSTATFGSYPLLVRHRSDAIAVPDDRYEWLTGAETSRAYDLGDGRGASTPSVFAQAIVLGLTHIVPKGLDHMLFVVGLLLLTTNARAILIQVSAFTLAHSITLALGVLGAVSIPAAMIEPLIALSIVYVGVANLCSSSLARERVVVVFLFGLLHGLGFAEALASLELSGGNWLATLAGFNLGVELGQLVVIASAALVLAVLRACAIDHRAVVVRPASIVIALAGMLWAIERAG